METQDVMLILGASAARPKMAVQLVLGPRYVSLSAHSATLRGTNQWGVTLLSAWETLSPRAEQNGWVWGDASAAGWSRKVPRWTPRCSPNKRRTARDACCALSSNPPPTCPWRLVRDRKRTLRAVPSTRSTSSKTSRHDVAIPSRLHAGPTKLLVLVRAPSDSPPPEFLPKRTFKPHW